jgi:hypothetical protein
MGGTILSLAVAAAAALAGPAAAAAQPPATSGASIAVTPTFLHGRWTDDGNCNNFVEFFADGRFATAEGAQGRWGLSGGRITFQGSQTVSARIEATSRTRIVLRRDDGTAGQSTRCTPAPRQVAMPPIPASPQAALAMSRPASWQLLLGRWTDSGDCADIIEFFPDGRFTVPSGSGTWALQGERLTFTGQTTTGARLRAVGQNRILLIHDDQRVGQSVRC